MAVKTIYKVKWKNVFKLSTILICLVMFFSITVILVNTYKNYTHAKNLIKDINDNLKLTNLVDNESTYIIEPYDELNKFDSYWKYIKMSLIQVDMAYLKKMNANSIGWLQLKGTKINYPVLKYSDNEFYKNHSFDKEKNKLGWIYLDSNNSTSELNKNTIIYGNHTMHNILFGNLDDIFKKDWKNNDDNHIIKFSTGSFSTLWQIVSVYKTDNINHIKVEFNDEEEFINYTKNIINKSEIDFDSKISSDDKIITLTTSGESKNIVVHAKLLKIRKEL